jgi:MoaA/NifB/PqqE/SkfB family radical SAM enzyme
LHDAGLDCALVSLHSPDAAVSDAETRAPGTHVRTVAGIRNLLYAGVQVILNVLMTPRTLPTLHAWPAFAASHFGGTSLLRQIIFSIPCKPFDTDLATEVVPDPYEVSAVLPGVIEEALRLGLPVNGLEMPCGPPMCAFGADARVATLAPLPGPIDFRTHVPACDPCAARPFCFGPRNEQIELFGDEWVVPIRTLPGDVSRTVVPQRPLEPRRRASEPAAERGGDDPPPVVEGASTQAETAFDEALAARNVAVAREVLAPLFDPIAQRALLVSRLEADPREPAVSFDLSAGGASIEVRLRPRDETAKAFLRTPSFDVSYRSDHDQQHRPLTPTLKTALALLKRALELTDRGGYQFEQPIGAAPSASPSPSSRSASRSLPVIGERRDPGPRKDVLNHRWDRAVFDAAVEPAFVAAAEKEWVVSMIKQGCEQHCVFCPSADKDKTNSRWSEIAPTEQLDDTIHQLRRARALGARNVAIGANEPLSFPFIFEVLEEATRLGFERINLQSTALPLSNRSMAERLAKLDRVELLIPIYGATAAEHESITHTAGSFDRLCTALDHIVALGAPRFRLQTLALASTFHRIEAIADFVRERFDTTLFVAPLRANRVGEREHLGDAARLADVRALAHRRPELKMTEFPLCVLGPSQRERRAVDRLATTTINLWALGLEQPEDPIIVRDRTYGFGDACAQCSARSECPGFLRPYLDQHGGAEAMPLLLSPG